jgi:hypothetical protein
MTPPSCLHQRRQRRAVRATANASEPQRLGRRARAPGAAERTTPSRQPRTNGPDPAWHQRLPASCHRSCHRDKPGPPRTGWNYPVVAAHPDHPADMRQQNASRRPVDDHRPASEGQPAAAHRPTQARQRTCKQGTPRPPNGVEQQPGRSLLPRRVAPHAPWEGASTTFRRCGNPLRARPPSARARCARRAWEGVPPVSWGRRGAIACGPAERSMGSRLDGQAAPKGADRAPAVGAPGSGRQ